MALKEEHKALVQKCEEQREAAALAIHQVLVLTEERQQLQLDHDRLANELTDTRASSETFSLDRAKEHEQMNTTVCTIRSVSIVSQTHLFIDRSLGGYLEETRGGDELSRGREDTAKNGARFSKGRSSGHQHSSGL